MASPTLEKIETLESTEEKAEMLSRLVFKAIAEDDHATLCKAVARLENLSGMTTEKVVEILGERFAKNFEGI